MDYVAEIYTLTNEFYFDYPHHKYPEILRKKNRPYSCLLIEYREDIFSVFLLGQI